MKKSFTILMMAAMIMTYSAPAFADSSNQPSGDPSTPAVSTDVPASNDETKASTTPEANNNNTTASDVKGDKGSATKEAKADTTASDAEVKIDSKHFPDPEFMAYVNKNFDTDKNGTLSEDELKSAKVIDMKGNDNLESLSGIEYLPHLTKIDCSTKSVLPDSMDSDDISHYYGGNVKTLDVTHNPELEVLDCSGNSGISALDLSKNPKLTSVKCESLSEVSSIDVTGCPDLEVLDCASTAVSKVDVSKNPKLKELNVSGTHVSSVDVTSNKDLEKLNVSSCMDENWEKSISSVDVTKNPKLKELEVEMTNISTLDVSNNPDLKILYVFNTKLQDLDISNNNKLVRLDMNHTGISSLDVTDKRDLFALNVEFTNISKLDVTKNPELYEVYMTGDSKISNIDLTKNHKLVHLRVSGTSISDLDLSGNPLLAAFYNNRQEDEDPDTWESRTIEAAPIKHLDLSHTDQMFEMYLDGSPIKELDLSRQPGLRHIHLDGCKNIKNIDVSKNPNLVSLTIADTNIHDVDLSNNKKLSTLDISNTNIPAFQNLDLTGYTKMLNLKAENAGLKSVKFDPNSKLASVEVSSNNLSTLDLTGMANPGYYVTFSGSDQEATGYLPEEKIKSKKIFLRDLFSDPDRVTVKEGDGYTYDAADQSITFDSDTEQAFNYTYSTMFQNKADEDLLSVHMTIKDEKLRPADPAKPTDHSGGSGSTKTTTITKVIKSVVPETGDTQDILLPALALLCAASALGGIAWRRKKNN